MWRAFGHQPVRNNVQCGLLQVVQVRSSMEGAASTSSMRQLPALATGLPLSGRSCWVFGPNNWLRLQLHRVLCHSWFENAILVLIFASSIALALDMPHLDPTGPFKGALEVADCVFAVLFLVEAVLKVSNWVGALSCCKTATQNV